MVKQFTWISPLKRRQFFEKYAKDNGFDFLSPRAWYSQPIKRILSTQGIKSAIQDYRYSVPRALIALFPDIGLEEKKFKYSRQYRHTLQQWDKRRAFFMKYAREKGFYYLSPDSWYLQPLRKILRVEGASFITNIYNRNVAKALIDLFPEIGLEKSKFKSLRQKGSNSPAQKSEGVFDESQLIKTDINDQQGHLEQVVKDLFPREHVISNSRKKSQVIDPKTGYFVEIDIWIPNIQLGFEFQDNYHYINAWYTNLSLDAIQKKDNIKRDMVNLSGITLIQVPCWWDGTAESLVGTIQFERPDVLAAPKDVIPIALSPTLNFFPNVELPEVGTLMLASFPSDPNFKNSISSDTWWMGEKYDGVRCCWVPEHRAVYSRSGRLIPVVNTILAVLPQIPIDGELWFGRGMFSAIYTLLYGESSWPGIRMISFDTPRQSCHHLTFEQRYEVLINSILERPVNILAQRMLLCEGGIQLNLFISMIIESGGEGVIMRRVGSRYQPGRNTDLIKLKTSYGDTEGLVVAVNASVVSLMLPNNQTFKVPLEHVHVLPLTVGEVVTFSYEKYARRDSPVHAEIVKRRDDLKWEDVVANSQTSHFQAIESQSENFTAQPRGFWTFANMRKYLENFIRNKLNLDPLLHSTWNKVPISAIRDSKTGSVLFRKFKDTFTALTSLFPDIGAHSFDKFKTDVKRPWGSILNRRQFFEKYAKANKFDYLSPIAWYPQPIKKVLSVKGGAAILGYYNNSMAAALIDIFPDIGLEKSKFKYVSK